MNLKSNEYQVWKIPEGADRLRSPVSLFKGCRGDVKALDYIILGDLIKKIRDPQNDQLIELTNQLKQKKRTAPAEYDDLKESACPAFIPGRFPKRNNHACELYVPLLLLDVDSIQNSDQLLSVFRACQNCPYVFAAFLSPSYMGFRILIWCDSDFDSHKVYYTALLELFAKLLKLPIKSALQNQWREQGLTSEEINARLKQTAHFDSMTKNIARLWFYNHVPEDWFYLNLESKIFRLDATPPKAPKLPSPAAPRSSSGNGYKVNFTHAEKIDNLIEQIVFRRIDITRGFNNWFKIGCALASEFGESGRSRFQAVSQFHTDYNSVKTDEEYNRCLKKHFKDNITIGSFYKFAKDHAVTLDFQALKANYPQVFNQTVVETEEKQPEIVNDQSVTVDNQADTVGLFPVEYCPNIEIPEEFEIDDELASKNLNISNNCYTWKSRSQKGEETTSEISNFVVIPLYLLIHNKNPKRIWHLVNCFGEEATICISVQDITNNSKLSAVIEGRGNFIPDWTSKQLAAMKRIWYHEEKKAEEISILGFQRNYQLYAFCNGVFYNKVFYHINNFGIVDTPKGTFYLPPLSNINKDDHSEYNHERKFRYLNTPTGLSEWSGLMCRVFGDNGKIGLCFLMAAVFRDVIFSYLDCFPLLFLFGPPKTGKSTFRESLLSLFGVPQTAISLGSSSSPKGFARKLSQFINAVVCFEEYKNGIKKGLKEMLKGLYDGMGYERAMLSNDHKTHSSPVNSACIVAGQELPVNESALFSRLFVLEFGTMSRDSKADFELLKEKENEGLGNVLLQILQYRKQIKRRFKSVYKEVYEDFKKDNTLSQTSDRSLMHVAILLTPFRIIAEKEALPFTYDEMLELCTKMVLEQDGILQRTNEVSNFWQLFEHLINEKYIHSGTHYRYDRDKDALFVSISRVYALYRDHGERQGLMVLDKESLVRYLKLHPSFVEQAGNRDQKKIRMSNDNRTVWAYQFNFEALKSFFESEEL